MIIVIEDSFKKDFKKLKNPTLEKRVLSKIQDIENSPSLENISNIKKLIGFQNFYRIRIWDYRLGFEVRENGDILILVIRHRKDIYNIFP